MQVLPRRTASIGAVRLIVVLLSLATSLSTFATGVHAAGSATITVTSFAKDGKTPLPFVRFQVTDSNGTVYGPLESVPDTGKVSFTVDPADNSTTFKVEEETPPACAIAPDPKTVGPLQDGDSVDLTFSTSFNDDNCDLGSISVYSYKCPDSVDGSSTKYSDFQGACTDTINNQNFKIADSNGQNWTIVTGQYGISGRAPLVGLDPGDFKVTDQANDSPVVFCAKYPVDPAHGTDPTSIAQADVKNGTFTVSLNNDRIACDVFTVASAAGNEAAPEGGNVSPASTGNSSIELHLAQCPAGYSGKDFFDDCHGNGIEGKTFSITGPNGFSDSKQTFKLTNPGPGVATFENLAGGNYFISENIPTDSDLYYVFCSHADSDQTVKFTYDDSKVDGIDLKLASNLAVVCDWYIVPNLDYTPTTINVTKFTCDAGYDASGKSFDNLQSDCPDTTEGVKFTLDVEGGANPTAHTTGSSGKVAFKALAPGNYWVTESAGDGFKTPVVYCTLVPPGNPASLQTDRYSVSNGKIGIALDGKLKEIDCSWFNIPDAQPSEPSSIQIHKSLCPDGLTSGYYDHCYTTVMSGIEFDLAGPNSFSASKTTNSNGVLTFSDLQKGNYTITEIPPDSPHVAVYVAICTENGQPFKSTYDDSTGLRIKLTLPATGANVVCDWYNVPPPKGPTGSITINKSLCQGKSNNQYNWSKDCTNYGAGAGFELKSVSSGSTWDATTDANGSIVFTGLADGAYSLDETTGNWCHAEADSVDSKGNVLVNKGGNTTVYIYNCGKKPVSVLPDTGVGAAVSSSGTGWWMWLFGLTGIAGLLLVRHGQSRRPALARVRSH